MESKFHRWWLGSCVAALLLASWAGGFSVAVTAVFVVVYLTGVTLVGPEDEADVGLAGAESPAEPGSQAPPVPAPEADSAAKPDQVTAPQGAQSYPDEADAEPYPEAPADLEPVAVDVVDMIDAVDVVDMIDVVDVVDTGAVLVETSEGVDTAAMVVEIPDDVEPAVIVEIPDESVDTAAVVVETDDTETEALIKDADAPEPSSA